MEGDAGAGSENEPRGRGRKGHFGRGNSTHQSKTTQENSGSIGENTRNRCVLEAKDEGKLDKIIKHLEDNKEL